MQVPTVPLRNALFELRFRHPGLAMAGVVCGSAMVSLLLGLPAGIFMAWMGAEWLRAGMRYERMFRAGELDELIAAARQEAKEAAPSLRANLARLWEAHAQLVHGDAAAAKQALAALHEPDLPPTLQVWKSQSWSLALAHLADWEGALAFLDSMEGLWEGDPGRAEAACLAWQRARILHALGRHQEAVDVLEPYLDDPAVPGSAPLHSAWVAFDSLIELGAIETARDLLLSRALDRFPTDEALAVVVPSLEYLRASAEPGALASMAAQVRAEGRWPAPWVGLMEAWAALETHRIGPAVEALGKASGTARPGALRAYLRLLGRLLVRLDRGGRIERDLLRECREDGVGEDGRFSVLLHTLGPLGALEDPVAFRAVLAAVEGSLGRPEGRPDRLFQLGCSQAFASIMESDWVGARRALEGLEAESLVPELRAGRLIHLAWCELGAGGSPGTALGWAREARLLFPGRGAARTVEAAAALECGEDPGPAFEAFSPERVRADSLLPANRLRWAYYRALAARRLGRAAEAEEAAALLRGTPGGAPYLDRLAAPPRSGS